MVLRKSILGTLVCLSLSSTYAAGLFDGDITAVYPDGDSKRIFVSYNKLTDAIDFWSNANVDAQFGPRGFDESTDNLRGTVNYRNLPIYFDYDHTAKTLTIIVRKAGITKVFTAADAEGNVNLDKAKDEFESWFKTNENGQVTKLLQAYVRDTATDVIAGNPASMGATLADIASQMQDNYNMDMNEVTNSGSFGSAANSGAMNAENESSDSEGDVDQGAPVAPTGDVPGYRLISMDPTYGSYNLGNGQHMTTYGLPLGYTFHFNDDRSQIKIALPLYMSNIDGARSYSAAFGVSYTQYINRYWALTPSVFGGASGSIDLGSGGIMINGGLSSHASLPIERFVLGMTNAASYMTTMPVTIAGYQIKYDVQNWGFTNGVDGAYRFATAPFAVGLYFNNTAFAGGDKWYIPSYNQVGVRLMNVITRDRATYTRFVLDTGYLFAQHNYNGINLTLGMQF